MAETLLPTIDIRTGKEMASFAVDPDNLPQLGDLTDLHPGVTWIVCGVVWKGHPDRLQPTAIRLIPLETVKDFAEVGKRLGGYLGAGLAAAFQAVTRLTQPDKGDAQ